MCVRVCVIALCNVALCDGCISSLTILSAMFLSGRVESELQPDGANGVMAHVAHESFNTR